MTAPVHALVMLACRACMTSTPACIDGTIHPDRVVRIPARCVAWWADTHHQPMVQLLSWQLNVGEPNE